MPGRSQKKNVSMQQVITALLDPNNPFPPLYLHHFSDLEGPDLRALKSAWPQVPDNRRFILLEDLEDLAEVDTLVSFDNVARMALDDPDPRVRTVAVRLLWEATEAPLARRLMAMLVDDPSPDVRAAAASALGAYVYQGELEELSPDLLHEVEESLLAAAQGADDTLVRRRAVEALGFSGRKEVPPLIQRAYADPDPDWLVTALFAMGRSADAVWEADVKRMLNHPKSEVQFEAVRAAGELGLEATRRILLNLLEEEVLDPDVYAAAVWSLSQIGGEQVRETLEALLEDAEENEGDDEEIEMLSNALDNLSFTEDTGLYSLFDLDELGQPNDDEAADFLRLAGAGPGALPTDLPDLDEYLPTIEDDDDDFTASSGGEPPAEDSGSAGSGRDKDKRRKRHRKS